MIPNNNNKYTFHSQLIITNNNIKINNISLNNKKAEMIFDHGFPVECIAALPNGFSFVSVGGTETKIWDIRTGQTIHSIVSN